MRCWPPWCRRPTSVSIEPLPTHRLRGEDPESQLAEQLGENYHDAGLPPKQIAMLEFAEFLTTNPSGITEDWVNELRSVGWADEDVIDIVHVAALYNYMCRVADGLGVELQPDRGWEDLAPDLSFQGETAPKVFATITSAPETTAA